MLAEYRPGGPELTAHVSTQVPHLVRKQLAECLRLDEGSVRVLALDVGGGFGLKLGVYPEDVMACLHSMSLRRPVKWVEDRGEHFRATTHGRESVHDYRIAACRDGRILAMTDVYANDLGGLNSPFGSSQLSTVVFNGPYKVDDGFVERRIVVTNKTPSAPTAGTGSRRSTSPTRGSWTGSPAALEMDPVELRAMNMVKPAEFPWVNPTGAVYDSGDYERCLRMAAEAVGWGTHRAAGANLGRTAGTTASVLVLRRADRLRQLQVPRQPWFQVRRPRVGHAAGQSLRRYRPLHRRLEHRAGQRDRLRVHMAARSSDSATTP